MNAVKEYFGDIDIYLFDQLLKGRFDHCNTVLDVGCGSGRNLIYFLKNGFDVYGIDPDPSAISRVQKLSSDVNPSFPSDHFNIGVAEELPYAEDYFDLIICSAVLHFAKDQDHFEQMLNSMWNVLKPGGYFFARLASSIGIEHLVKETGKGLWLLPDGSIRYLVNEKALLEYTSRLNGILFEPIKTTNVQNLRCMTTWCLQKR
ncbi:type 11 methyltransferase [Sporocytophaga myxococcoides]|uniref:Type 11 methyltransferase n=1 Tax=Sporocytophaga myxococcoides TaxID=153721 RepID=A0A098LHE8_9BACT|nr:class I SAM-dependent methyltransferase [Sporocytophaga myxococcoides]GAL85842.1 type 11 methyltransferase [Sporocytophaga myxococcoides]